MPTDTKISLRIQINDETLAHYDTQSRAHARTIEQEVSNRIAQFATVDSQKPLVFNDQQRQKLEQLCGQNFNDAETVIGAVQRALVLNVEETRVALTPQLVGKLRSRCIGMPFEKFLSQIVKRALEEFVGLR